MANGEIREGYFHDRYARLLDMILRARHGLTIQDLVQRSGYSRPQVSKIMHHLVKAGILRNEIDFEVRHKMNGSFDGSRKASRYMVEPSWLVRVFDAQRDWIELARPARATEDEAA